MKRKTYIKKIWALEAAIAKHPSTMSEIMTGESLKHSTRYAKKVPANFGSYEAAWNCDAMKWARSYYLGESV